MSPSDAKDANYNDKSRNKFSKKIIKIFIAGIIVLFGLYYCYHYFYIVNQKISSPAQPHFAINTNQLNKITTELEQLKGQLAVAQDDLTRLNNISSITATQEPNYQANLLNIKNLVTIAIVKLNIEKDVDAASEALMLAQQNLLNTHSHDLQTLRRDILIKLEQLKGIKQADVLQIKAALQEYANIIDKVSVLDFVSAIKNEKAVSRQNREPEDPNETLWRRFIINFQNNFYELVKIRNIKGSDVSFAKLQSEEHINLIKTYFKLKTTELSIDLQQRNQKFFKADVNDLLYNTNLYFANNLDLKQKLLNLLNSIKDVNINPDLPELYSLADQIDKLIQDKKQSPVSNEKLITQ